MCADEEVARHARPRAATPAVAQVGLPGEVQGLARQIAPFETGPLDNGVEGFDGVEVGGKFRVNHRVDEQRAARRPGVELSTRPIDPLPVLVEDVDQHAGVDEDHFRPGSAASSS